MAVLDKLLQINLQNKEKFQNAFVETVNAVKSSNFSFEFSDADKGEYYIVTEENRMNSNFIHIVPKQIYYLFKEMQAKAPNDFLGFSVLAGNHNGKDVRVSCFGVDCSSLGKSLFKA